MSESVKISLAQVWDKGKLLIILTFAFGGWAANVQMDINSNKERSISNENIIIEMQSDRNKVQLQWSLDISEIKNSVNTIKIYQEGISEKVTDLKNKK